MFGHSPPRPFGQAGAGPRPPALPAMAPPAPSPTQVGVGATFVGTIRSQHAIEVFGTVRGDVVGAAVHVHEAGDVTGAIMAEQVTLKGRVQGPVRARRALIQAGSRVLGDVMHHVIAVELGADIVGRLHHVEDPLAGIAMPAAG